MAKNGFKVMDSDMHVMEPPDLWDRYIDPEFKHRVRSLNRRPMDMAVELEGRHIIPHPRLQEGRDSPELVRAAADNTARFADGIESNFDPASQLLAMDAEGIDVAILFPSTGLHVLGMWGIDPELAAAISRAYNDWLHEFCQASPDRMYGSAMIAPQDVESAVSETRRMAQKGFKSIFLGSNRVDDRNWSDPYYDPLWAECQSLGIPVGLHVRGLPDPSMPHAGSNFLPIRMWYSCHSLNTMENVVDFVGGGVLERFPTLKVAFLEANCSWAPWLLWRMDEQQEWTTKYGHQPLPLKPSEYFMRQCFVSIEGDEEPASYLAQQGFEDHVVFSTDYPHPDSAYPKATENLLRLPLSDQTKRKFLWDNCVRLYDIQS